MAFAMLALYLIIVPIVFLLSIVPASLVALVDPQSRSLLSALLSGGARLVIWFAAALILVGAAYSLVPNRRAHWREWQHNWQGTVVAAALILPYELLFRSFVRYVLHADNYGTVAAFALVILLFLYYLTFILLLGAEINSWLAGQRAAASDLPSVLHAVQVHHILRGAAGPTARHAEGRDAAAHAVAANALCGGGGAPSAWGAHAHLAAAALSSPARSAQSKAAIPRDGRWHTLKGLP